MRKYSVAVGNIIDVCLRVQADDRVVVVTDQERLSIGQAICNGAVEKAREAKLIVIEDFSQRPAKELSRKLTSEIDQFRPTASVYAATGKSGELPVFRMPLINHLTKKHNTRHAHMVGIDEQLMLDGMSQDYQKIQKVIGNLRKILEPARNVQVSDRFGTNLKVKLSPKLNWITGDGLISKQGFWTNLPDGEIFTCPKRVDGTLVAWEIGDYFSEKYGVLKKPLKFFIKNSRITSISGENKKLVTQLKQYISEYKNGERVGEFAIGALLGLKKLVGNLLQDEKFPGIHLAFGSSYSEKTGANWDSSSHVDVIPLKVNVLVDGRPILKKGKFVVDLSK